MNFPSPRILGVCAVLVLPASAIAQSRSPTIFSPASRIGTVNIRAAVVGRDYGVKPLPLMAVVALRNNRVDSVAGRTDLDGRLSMKLDPGAYTLRARTPQPVAGRSFTWAVPITVRAGTSMAIELTNANASADSLVVVASAPQPAPASRPAEPRAEPTPAPTARPVPPVAAPATGPAPQPAAQPAPQPVAQPAAQPAAPPPAPAAAPMAQPAAAAPSLTTPSRPMPRSLQPAAPRSNTAGLFLGLGLNGSALKSDDLMTDTESGGGLSALLGWGFTRQFALFLDASAARIATPNGDFDLGHFDAGARWHFARRSSALVPFLEVAFSGRAAMEKDVVMMDGSGNSYQGDLTIFGTGFSLGGGLQYFITSSWALGGSGTWTSGEFSDVRFDNVSVRGFEFDATSARFNFGFTWYPMGGHR